MGATYPDLIGVDAMVKRLPDIPLPKEIRPRAMYDLDIQ